MNIGQAIRFCRMQKGVSQGAVARLARCSVSYLSMLENNKRDPTLSTVTRIADALDVPVGLLFLMAANDDELGVIGGQIKDQTIRAALAHATAPVDVAIRVGGPHG